MEIADGLRAGHLLQNLRALCAAPGCANGAPLLPCAPSGPDRRPAPNCLKQSLSGASPRPEPAARRPRARTLRALRNWCWSAAEGNGTRIDGLPAAASSATAPAPARQTTRSAAANAAGMSSRRASPRPPGRTAKPARVSSNRAWPGLVNQPDRSPTARNSGQLSCAARFKRPRTLAAAGDQHRQSRRRAARAGSQRTLRAPAARSPRFCPPETRSRRLGKTQQRAGHKPGRCAGW